MSSWHSYPSCYNFGHKAITDLLKRDVIVQEKVDGSQFSFGWFPEKHETDGLGLMCKSKGAILYIDAPQKMFKRAVDVVKRLREEDKLVPGWTYRGEVLDKPKHNALAYDRIPQDHIILFDINPDEEAYLHPDLVEAEAARLGLECVPTLFIGRIETIEEMRRFLDTTSVLGGQKIEGIVAKPLNRDYFGIDKKLLMGKYVSEGFKEVHYNAWKEANPSRTDIVLRLTDMLSTPARWQKAVIHLREQGLIENSPRDIGQLIKHAQHDIEKEEADLVRDALFSHFMPQILRGAVAGLPQWYKDQLMAAQFEQEEVGAEQ